MIRSAPFVYCIDSHRSLVHQPLFDNALQIRECTSADKQIYRIGDISRIMAFLLLAATGTSTSLPSSSFNNPCCTDSPLTSLWLEFLFLAILSISSIKIIPCSAFSTSLSAAARSLDTTLSMSSPIYPASVRDVAYC